MKFVSNIHDAWGPVCSPHTETILVPKLCHQTNNLPPLLHLILQMKPPPATILSKLYPTLPESVLESFAHSYTDYVHMHSLEIWKSKKGKWMRRNLGVTEWCTGRDIRGQPWNFLYKLCSWLVHLLAGQGLEQLGLSNSMQSQLSTAMMRAFVLAKASWGYSVPLETWPSLHKAAMATVALAALLVSNSNLISIAGGSRMSQKQQNSLGMMKSSIGGKQF